jgi:hypothetical protein
MPANTEINVKAFRGVIEFESLKPDAILAKMYPKILKKKYTLDEIITGR